MACALLLARFLEFDGMENAGIAWLARYSGTADAGQERLF